MQNLEDQREKCLRLLQEIMKEVCYQLRTNQTVNIPKSQYMTFYDLAFDLKNDEVIILKDVFQEWFSNYLEQTVIPNLISTKNFIETFIEKINDLKSLFKYLSNLLFKYDNYTGAKDLYIIEYGLIIFDNQVMNLDVVKQRYQDSYIELINNIRLRNSNNEKQVLQNLLQILNYFTLAQKHRIEIVVIEKQIIIRQMNSKFRRSTMQSPVSNYDTFLFPFVLETTRKFYQDLSISWIQSGTSQEYIKKATNQFIIEKNLEDNFYTIFSKKDLLHQTFVNEILEQRVDQIICNPNDGIQQLFQQMKNSQDLSPITRMYVLYKNSKSKLENLLNEFQIFIQLSITTVFAVQANANENQLQQKGSQQAAHLQQINNLQTIFEYCANLVSNCFENSHKFRNHMELSFKEKINQVERIVDKLAMYIDYSLSEKLKETNNDYDRQRFDKFKDYIYNTIKLLNNKSRLFQSMTNDLKGRMFKGKIKNIGYELELLKYLKSCYYEDSSFRDSQKILENFKIFRNHDEELNQQLENANLAMRIKYQCTLFEQNVLLNEFKSGYEIKFPQFIQTAVNFMEQYYQKKFKRENKLLVWNFEVGQATINLKFGQKIIRLIVSNLQLCILLALQQSEGKSKSEIISETGIKNENSLDFQLQPIIDMNLVLNQGGTYKIQKDFTKLLNKRSTVPYKKVQTFEDDKQIKEQSNYRIRSYIVRLMKSNKEMKYQSILNDVQSKLSEYYDFTAFNVKIVIDSLIEQNYIKRDQKDMNKFIYTDEQ